jgi:enolase
MPKISQLKARQILDSKGNPTVEVTVLLDNGISATASCPSGTSTGSHEAIELRDADNDHFNGKGVLKAVENINKAIAGRLIGNDPSDQSRIDQLLIELDGTENKSKLGANAILAVSLACCKAGAKISQVPIYYYVRQILAPHISPTFPALPTLLCNLLNGGLHAGSNLDMQEFMLIPTNTHSLAEAIEQVVAINHTLRTLLIKSGFQTLVGDEGGFAPILPTNQAALDLLTESIQSTKLKLANQIKLGIDAAASSFFKNGLYTIKDAQKSITAAELGNLYKEWINKYKLLYLEDPFSEDDLNGWAEFTPSAPAGTLIVGDDLTCTNPQRLDMAIKKQMIRGVIVKPNQIGTVTETLEVVQKAKSANLKIIVSHRSGETNDDFIADFAVGVGADYAKFGAPVRGERVAKYNRLLQIEQDLNSQ